MKHTGNFLRANSGVSSRRILLLHDNDVKIEEGDFGHFAVRVLPKNEGNTKFSAGIENLLPEHLITDDFYSTKKRTQPDGSVVTTEIPQKMKLCKALIESASAEDFEGLLSALSMIEDFLSGGLLSGK